MLVQILATAAPAVGLITAASQARAATFTATFTGTVTSGHDEGVFGAAGDLRGQSFTLVFVGESAAGSYNSYSGPTYQNHNGGSYWGAPSVNNATLSINGVSTGVPGSFLSQNYAERASDFSAIYITAQSYGGIGNHYNYVYANLFEYSGTERVFPASLEQAFTIANLTAMTSISNSGFFQTYSNARASGYLAFDSVVISQTPLPAALPLFASALGLGGLLGYRRKRREYQLGVAMLLRKTPVLIGLALSLFLSFAGTTAHAVTYLEEFEYPFGDWEERWLGQKSDLSNYYVAVNGMAHTYRGNNPDGILDRQ